MTRNIKTGPNYDAVDIAQVYELFIVPRGRSYSTKSLQPLHGCAVQSFPTTPQRQAQFFTGGGVGVAAEATVGIVPFGTANPALGTKTIVGLPCSIGGTPEIVYGGYITQADDTPTNVAAGVKGVFDSIIDPTNTMPTGGFVRCSNRNASETDITAALVALFGSDEDAAVDATAGLLTFTFGSTGVGGNDMEIITEVQHSLPGPLPQFTNGICTNMPGLKTLGSAVSLNDAKGATLIDLINDQVFSTAAKLPGRSNPQYQFQLHELIRNFELRALLGQTENQSQTGTDDYLLNDGQPTQIKKASFLAVLRGTYVTEPDWIWVPESTLSFDALAYTVNAIPATQVTVAPRLSPGSPIVTKQGNLFAAYTF